METARECLSEWMDNRRLLLIIASTLLGLFALAAFGMLYVAQAVFFPITLAVVLKLVFGPVVRYLNAWRVPNVVGAGLVVGGILALTVAAVTFLAGPAQRWFDAAPGHIRELEFKLRSFKEPMKRVSDAGSQVEALTEVGGKEKPIPVKVNQPGVTAVLFDTTSEVMIGAFLTLVMLYFMLAGGDRFLEKVLDLSPAWGSKRRTVALAHDIQRIMSSYLFAMTCINVVLGAVIGIGMWLVGLPNPVLWGVMAAGLNYVPYFGCILGTCIVFVVGIISLDSLGQAIWAPTIYLVANGIEGYFITPAILGRSFSLSPLAIIISMILWGWLWGVGGMLLVREKVEQLRHPDCWLRPWRQKTGPSCFDPEISENLKKISEKISDTHLF
jgi:predicted PurR-regulated permease PerM